MQSSMVLVLALQTSRLSPLHPDTQTGQMTQGQHMCQALSSIPSTGGDPPNPTSATLTSL